MNSSSANPPPNPPPVWQPRFSIGMMLMIMLLFSVMAAAASYLVRGLRDGDRTAQLVFILMTLASPVLLMVLVSVARQIAKWTRRRNKP